MAVSRPRRVVIDTNIWISAFINPLGEPGRLLSLALLGRVILVVSDYLLDEILAVSRRSRIQRRLRITPDRVESVLAGVRRTAVYVETDDAPRICRDAGDDAILATAIRGQANYLVSRDDDIKRDPTLIDELASRGVVVLSVARFLDLLDAESA
jgi:putative PIN family toxin of toxin-antitoxin system